MKRPRWPIGQLATFDDEESTTRVVDSDRERADPESGARDSWILAFAGDVEDAELDPETWELSRDGVRVGELV